MSTEQLIQSDDSLPIGIAFKAVFGELNEKVHVLHMLYIPIEILLHTFCIQYNLQ